MALQLVVPPLVEPVSLDEAKVHLRVDSTVEDSLIGSLITTSRLHIEAALGMALISQSWRVVLDCWPLGDVLALPLRPVSAVTEIRVRDQGGATKVVDSVGYAVDLVGAVPRISSRTGYWPMPGVRMGGIEIDLAAGYGALASDVPAPIRQALLMLVAHWYEHREPAAVGTEATRIPDTVSSLLAPFRVVSI
ncbi:MAG TPA: head-tail connector protein [Hyphomicrobiaceae bacterium]|nr:head-tail connector protein [Hyphomicrobiaceae bacterium]